MIAHLVEQIKAGQKARINIAGWKNKSKAGKPYFTIKASPEYKPKPPEPLLEVEADELDL